MSEANNNLYKFQEWLETKVSAVLPEEVEILCRRKGNIDNDVRNALSKIGVAVVIEPPLVRQWTDSYILKAEVVESEIHFIENVTLKKSDRTASGLLLDVSRAIHQERCDELGASVLRLGQIDDLSPADQPLVHYVLTVSNALNI